MGSVWLQVEKKLRGRSLGFGGIGKRSVGVVCRAYLQLIITKPSNW